MDKVIEKKLHAFVFRWIRHITYPIQNSDHHILTWNNLSGLHHSQIDNFVERCIHEQMDGQYGREKHQINSWGVPSFAVCERMLYANDYIIKVTRCRDSKTSFMSVIISACGSIIKYANNQIDLIRFGTEKYSNAIIDVIKKMENVDTASWEKLFSELDVIQDNINNYKINSKYETVV